ncbi:MAG: hypothetical protein H8D67_05890 [Deltaproteobacteria bacterium]|nr:hypothetical protein [Deltaproteobacteria bacterium]
MKYYNVMLWILFILAAISVIVGVVFKAVGVTPLGVAPISCIRFAAICLLGAIALGVIEISLKLGKPAE